METNATRLFGLNEFSAQTIEVTDTNQQEYKIGKDKPKKLMNKGDAWRAN